MHPSRPIPLAEPVLHGNEAEYVAQCLESGWITSGEFVPRLENSLCELLGTRQAVATSSGTAALHVALIVCGVKPGDLVIVSDLSFIAPANAVRYMGADPVFCDADPETWQIDPNVILRFLDDRAEIRPEGTVDRLTGRRFGAIVPVDALGHPVDMDAITEIGRRFGLPIVSDASESLGARYKGQPIGSKPTMTCLSFNGNKVVTAGGGGALVTASEALATEARYLCNQAKDDPVAYVHKKVGYNYRLSNIHAAIGCAQLERLAQHVAAKRAIAERYRDAFLNLDGVTFMPEAEWAGATYWLSTILLEGDRSTELLRALHKAQVEARPLWEPLHRSEAHFAAEYVGVGHSQSIARRSVSLPSSVDLSAEDQERVIEITRRVATS